MTAPNTFAPESTAVGGALPSVAPVAAPYTAAGPPASPKARPIASPGHVKYMTRQITSIRASAVAAGAQDGGNADVDAFLKMESGAPFSRLPDPAAPSDEVPDMLHGLSMAALQGATFGFADEAVGALYGSVAADEYRAELERFRGEHGIAAGLAEMVGGAVTAGPLARGVSALFRGAQGAAAITRGVPTAQRILASGAQGAIAGAISGAGNAPDGTSRLEGAEFGAAAGGPTGAILTGLGTSLAAIGRPAVRAAGINFLQRIPGVGTPEKHGLEGLTKALLADGLSLKEATQRVDDLVRTGAPVGLTEIGGRNTTAYLREAFAHSSPATQQFFEMMSERQAGQSDRLGSAMLDLTLNKNKLGLRNAYQVERFLVEARDHLSKPLYDVAHNETVPMTPALQRLLAHPILQRAYAAGRATAMDEDFAGVGHGLAVPPIGSNSALVARSGLTDIAAQATLKNMSSIPVRGLDYMKQGLDAVVDAAQRSDHPITSKQTRIFSALIDQVLAIADEHSPSYKQARETWGGLSAARDAVEAGREFLGKVPPEVANDVRQLSPQLREFYRVGAAQKLYDVTSGVTNERADIASRFFGGSLFGKNTADADRIRALFYDTPGRAESFLDRVATESRISQSTRDFGRLPARGAQTLEKQTEGTAPSIRGSLGLALVATGARALSGAKTRFFQEAGDELAQRALESDPTKLKLLLRQTLGSQKALRQRAGLGSRAAIVGGATAGGMQR